MEERVLHPYDGLVQGVIGDGPDLATEAAGRFSARPELHSHASGHGVSAFRQGHELCDS